MDPTNEPSQLTQPTPGETMLDQFPRRQFSRVNTYVPDDLNDKLRDVGARIRKSVTEGYATNKWNGEFIAPNAPRNPRAPIGLGRPSIFRPSPGETMRRIYTTPAQPSVPPPGGLQRFADFGEPPAKPAPGESIRVRAVSMGAQRPADTQPSAGASRKASAKFVPEGFDPPSDSESEGDQSPGDKDALEELFEFGEDDRSSALRSHLFGSAPPAAASEGNPRKLQQTQSLPAGSLAFGVRPSNTPLEPLGEDEPWRKHDPSKSAAMPPE